MSIHNDNVRIKIIKTLAILFVLGSLLYFILCLLTYSAVKQNLTTLPAEIDLVSLILGSIVWVLYSLIICYGLFKLRKWALYLFAIPVIWFFFWGVFEFFIYAGYTGQEFPLFYLLSRLFLGLMALYIYRERHLFKSALQTNEI